MLFGAVLFRVVCAVFFKLFIHFERIRASTLGDGERIKIIISEAVRLRAVRAALHELPVHSGRIRAVTQGALVTCCIFLLLYSFFIQRLMFIPQSNNFYK